MNFSSPPPPLHLNTSKDRKSVEHVDTILSSHSKPVPVVVACDSDEEMIPQNKIFSSVYFISKLRSHGCLFVVYLHELDCTGYKCLVRQVSLDSSHGFISNRKPLPHERAALAVVTNAIARAYSGLGLQPQVTIIEPLPTTLQSCESKESACVSSAENNVSFVYGLVCGLGAPDVAYVAGGPTLGGPALIHPSSPSAKSEISLSSPRAWPPGAPTAVANALDKFLGPSEVVFIRHGQTSYNEQVRRGVLYNLSICMCSQKLVQGQRDIPLNEVGLAQARMLSYEWPRYIEVYAFIYT
jgi:hypothetical protein